MSGPAVPSARRVRHGLRSVAGSPHRPNADRALADPVLGIYVVADGIGRARHGAWSAQFVVDTLPGLLGAGSDLAPGRAVRELNGRIHDASRNRLGGVGCTVVAAVVTGTRAVVVHVGDSRAYLWRDAALTRLTVDDALTELLVVAGLLDRERATAHPGRSVLTRHLGMPGTVEPAVCTVDLRAGDRLLLCSDGLTAVLPDHLLADVLRSAPGPGTACDRLIDAATAHGLVDDTTVLVLEAGEPVTARSG